MNEQLKMMRSNKQSKGLQQPPIDEKEQLITTVLWVIAIVPLLSGVIIFIRFHRNIINGIRHRDFLEFADVADLISGTVGPLWSLTGILLLIVTFRAQKKQFEENKKSASYSEFENTFFKLLESHHSIVNSLQKRFPVGKEIDSKKRLITRYRKLIGREVFNKAAQQVKKHYKPVYYKISDDEIRQNISDAFMPQYKRFRSSFSHYFRNLFHIIKFVDQYKELDRFYTPEEIEEIKYKYLRILRAQLSTYELIILWYNSLEEGLGWEIGEHGEVEGFPIYIGKYDLLKNLDHDANIVQVNFFKRWYEDVKLKYRARY